MQQGRSEGTNTLILLPSYHRACQCLCNGSPRAQEPHAAPRLLHPHRSAFRWGHRGYPGPHHSHSQDPQQEAACLSVQGQDGTYASTPSWSSSIMPLLPSSFPLQALPCSYHMQKSHVAFFSQAIGSGCLKRTGPADATASQAAHLPGPCPPRDPPCQPCTRRPGCQ